MRKLVGGCGVGVVLATALVAGDAAATVTLTASRADTLYTTETQFDCGALAGMMDVDLPYNVVRIRADDDTGQATSFRWKLPKPNVGFLLPDDPEIDSSAGGAFAVQSFCAQIGSGCILTKDTIKSYRRPTILWAAPTCETGLPRNTSSQFSGDTVTIRVKADGQRGRSAKATTDVGYGRIGSPILWISNLSGTPENGIGRKEVVTDLLPTFSVTVEAGIMPPVPIKDYVFENGNGQEQAVTECLLPSESAPGAAACARLPYEGLGPFFPYVAVRLEDDSAYCDNVRARVATCRVKTRLDVDRSPKKQAYRSGDEGEVTVTLRNQAPRNNGCSFIFSSLTCDTSVKNGGFEEDQSVTFEPVRCDKDRLTFCSTDLDCGALGPCLSESHCSVTTTQLCSFDADCSRRACPTCEAGETCTRVVQVPPVLRAGESAELVRELVQLRSVLPGKTRVTDTWAVSEAFGRGDTEAKERYKIRGDPVQ